VTTEAAEGRGQIAGVALLGSVEHGKQHIVINLIQEFE